jgi:hypothetical protein
MGSKMNLIDILIRLSRPLPSLSIKSRLLLNMKKVRPDADSGKYLFLCILAGVFVFFPLIVFFLPGGLFSAVLFSLLGSAIAVLFLLYIPLLQLKRQAAAIEAEMPFAIRTLGMLLDMNIPFLKALELVADEGGALSGELKRIVSEIKNGVTLEKSFSRLAISYDSFAIKRSISQMLSSYEVGSPGRELQRIGDELISLERHKMRSFASKSAVFGLIFIVSSAIVPTFFLIYSVLGRFALGVDISSAGIAIGLLFIFPMVSILVLLISKSLMPQSPFHRSGSVEIRLLIPGAVIIGSFFLLPDFLRFFGMAGGLIAALILSWKEYREESRMEKIEGYLPDGMLSIAGLPKSAGIVKVFDILSKGGYGPLSEEAAKSRRQLENNLSTDAVLDDLWLRNDSPMLKRISRMLIYIFDTNSFDKLNSLAEDILKSFEVRRERAQMASMQKYTLIFGAFIIPLILKITLNLLDSMVELFESAGAGQTLAFAMDLIPPYLVIYSLISSAYIGEMEEKRSGSMIYFLIMTIAGLLTFYFIDF